MLKIQICFIRRVQLHLKFLNTVSTNMKYQNENKPIDTYVFDL